MTFLFTFKSAIRGVKPWSVSSIGASEGKAACYSVFFEVRKDAARKKRIILRVQSAYLLDELTQRQRNARKVNLNVLLKAVYDGRTIRA
ncbi:hypothetical protein Q5W_21880 [Hydrogenophaga sp. PBC]|uniref:hypothetical protein n=1 Tax=Hydrogenophaga sp. PBC TaxID=795665 RepID=UPI0002606AAF|nr:hypothetical protein [Hydrogenophaga sp. PBC]AOS81412.1 hypothetical protein Q5W_21880 [Hydrogenophaga sp. PBC]